LYVYCKGNPVGLRDKGGNQASALCLAGGPETPWCWVGVGIDIWDVLFGTTVVVGTAVVVHEATRSRPLEFSSEPWTPPEAPPKPAPPVAPPRPVPPVAPPAPPVAPPRPVPPVAPPVPIPAPPPPVPRPVPKPEPKPTPKTKPEPKPNPKLDPRPKPDKTVDPIPPQPKDKDKPSSYVVRLQAQGGGLEESVVLTGLAPITVAQGVAGLETLKGKLSRRQLEERAEPFRRAERFIRNAPAGGGVGPPGQSFALPRSDIRVDVEILRGVNFRN